MCMRVGIVTGASRGIGAEFAKQLGGARPDLDEIWCISRTGMRTVAADKQGVSTHRGPRYRQIAFDQSVDSFGESLLNYAQANRASIAYLILNAAQADYGSVDEQSFSQADQMIQTNIRGTVSAVYSLRTLFEKDSHIILVSSISALAPTPGLAVYTASKAFIRHWGLSLREELKPYGVTVTICYPGKVRTQALRDVVKQAASAKLRLMPVQSVKYLVRRTLRAAERGRAEVTPGVYSLVMAAFRILPAGVIVRLASLV